MSISSFILAVSISPAGSLFYFLTNNGVEEVSVCVCVCVCVKFHVCVTCVVVHICECGGSWSPEAPLELEIQVVVNHPL